MDPPTIYYMVVSMLYTLVLLDMEHLIHKQRTLSGKNPESQ